MRAPPSSTEAAGAPPAVDEPERAGKWTMLAIVALGVFMATLDSSVVNISLPALAHHFGRPLDAAVMWVVIAYLVVVASLLLTIGRLADVVGRKPIWALGLIVFTLGSALCGAAPSLPLLIVFRAVQGVGGAMLMAIGPAMLIGAFPPGERGRAIGLNALFVALGVSTGPTLGGLITEHMSWRWIFYVNVPVGVVAVIATLRLLTERRARQPGRFDPAGAALLGVGLAALTGALTAGGQAGWGSPLVIAAGAAGVAALAAFVLGERRAPHPILDLGLFADRLFASATLSLVLSFMAIFAVGFLLPFYLEQVRHFSTATSGLLLTPFPLALAVAAPVSGALADRFGTRWLAAAGLAIACVGLLLIGDIGADASKADIAWRLGLTGVGQGMFQAPNNSALMGAVPPHRQGIASGILATGRVVGQSLSVALSGAVFSSLGGARAGRLLAVGAAPEVAAALRQTFLSSFRATLWVSAAVTLVGAVVSLVRGMSNPVMKRTVMKRTPIVVLDHLTVNVRDMKAARAFYQAALGAIGMRINMDFSSAFGMGSKDENIFWLARDRRASGGGHYALRVEHREEVDAFHAAALTAGGADNGKPGLRPDYGPNYYAAFVKDREGNNIEVVCYARPRRRARTSPRR